VESGSKTGYGAVRSIQKLEARDLALERAAVHDEVAQDRKIVRSGSMVMSGSTASQHASTSRPFMRTAQVPPFRAAEPAIGQIGRLVLRYQLSASRTRIHF
jgi:hypothetical protein